MGNSSAFTLDVSARTSSLTADGRYPLPCSTNIRGRVRTFLRAPSLKTKPNGLKACCALLIQKGSLIEEGARRSSCPAIMQQNYYNATTIALVPPLGRPTLFRLPPRNPL